MNKYEILDFVDTYKKVRNITYNMVVHDVKNRIFERFGSYGDELTALDIDDIEQYLCNDTWINYDKILEYYGNNKLNIEDLIDPTDIWQSMIHEHRTSIFDAVKCAVYKAHESVIHTIMDDIRNIF